LADFSHNVPNIGQIDGKKGLIYEITFNRLPMIRDHVKPRTLEFATTTTMPSKAAQTTLPFTRNTGRVRETSLTDSDALFAIRSSQFDGMEDLLD
jgi:hypothetical protein